MKKGWKVVSSEVGYEDSRVKVVKDRIVEVDGKETSRRVIQIKPGASVLPIDDEGFVYLVEEFHYGFGGLTTEAAAGGKEEGEDFLAAAKRELQEETGITAQEWVDLGHSFALTSYMHHEQGLYLARKLSFWASNPDSTESIELKKMPFAEAVAMVMDGRIFDAYTCVLILKAARYLGKL